MRVLVLIGATFAAGLLAGAMFWPDQRPARLPARDGGAGERDLWAWDRGNRGEPGRPRPHASEVAPADPGRRANASVRELTRDAEASLAQAGGAGALTPLDALIRAVIAALAGWGPAGATGVFRLARGQIANMNAGTIVYQLEFTLPDHVRITT